MSDYIHKFSNTTERNAATYSEPWVSLTKSNNLLEYNAIDVTIEYQYSGDRSVTAGNFIISPYNDLPVNSIRSITFSGELNSNSGVLL